ncbi:MAG: hypothetical protein NWE89_15380 [Candidatus Bathyarchaeota archaeon]|nr:hypothetical protein [Candidatus Bathyarchaeota archaeon]
MGKREENIFPKNGFQHSREDIFTYLISRSAEVPPELFDLISKAVSIIPFEVQEFVIDNLTFRTPNTHTDKEYILSGGIICLDSDLHEKKEGIETVLHEIAHGWLKHRMVDATVNNWEKQEKDADLQVEKWK